MDSLKATKYELIQEIMAISDNALLAKLKDVLKQEKNDIVAYTVDGQPLTEKDYIEMITTAADEAKKGNYITQDEVDKSIEESNRRKAIPQKEVMATIQKKHGI